MDLHKKKKSYYFIYLYTCDFRELTENHEYVFNF